MPDTDFVDYYELLQISPNAEPETIHRVYKMLAQRYHPDNPETGDTARFLLLNGAFDTLSNADLRRAYDTVYQEHRAKPIDFHRKVRRKRCHGHHTRAPYRRQNS